MKSARPPNSQQQKAGGAQGSGRGRVVVSGVGVPVF